MLKAPTHFFEAPSQLSNEPGVIWVFEIEKSIPKIDISVERPPLAVVMKSSDTELYLDIVNQLHPDVLLLENESARLQDAIDKLESQLLIRNKKKQSSRTLMDRNKELSMLAENLERLVEERTQWIEVSNREQKELIRSERRFVQFLIEIGLQNSQEDLLESFLQEFRQLRLAQEIYLVKRKKSALEITYIKNQEIQKRIKDGVWWTSRESEVLSENVLKQLAKDFSRPVGRLVLFPLPAVLDSSEEGSLGLLIEKGTSGPLSENDFSVIKKYVQALGLSLARVRLEEDNRVSALLWEKIFDGARDPIAIISQNFELLRSNQIFGEPKGLKKCYEIWAGRQEPCVGCPIVAQTRISQEINNKDRDYQVISQNISETEPMYLHRYVDITDLRQNNIRFIQNEKLTSIGQIAEQMAHEIYNPLAGIIALVQILLSDSEQSGTTRSDLEEIQKAAVRAQKVIENLQDFVKQEADMSSVSLDDIVEKTLPLLKMKWRAFRLDLQLNAESKKIYVQPQLVSQVVYNLIQNACQAMKSGQTLTLRTEVMDSFVRLIVADQGAGIAEAVKGSIFKPFFTTKPSGEGTGLGLSLSRQIVERFKGRLYFESKVEVGTTFYMEIPFEKAD